MTIPTPGAKLDFAAIARELAAQPTTVAQLDWGLPAATIPSYAPGTAWSESPRNVVDPRFVEPAPADPYADIMAAKAMADAKFGPSRFCDALPVLRMHREAREANGRLARKSSGISLDPDRRYARAVMSATAAELVITGRANPLRPAGVERNTMAWSAWLDRLRSRADRRASRKARRR